MGWRLQKYLRKTVSRVVSFIYEWKIWNIVISQTFNIKFDILQWKVCLEEEMKGSVGSMLLYRDHVTEEGGKNVTLSLWRVEREK